jgi:ADP-ribose pyrophosphatase
MTNQAATDALADSAADVTVSAPTLLGEGYHSLDRYSVTLRSPGHRGEIASVRDVLRVGKVTAVLPIDIVRGELVLIRQFRLPAHLATGAGELIEIVAGHVEAGETPAEAAMRECVEEIGVRPTALYEMLEFIPVPGSSDEHAFLFLGLVDATRILQYAGAADEKEATRPMRVPIDAALAALERGTMRNGFLIIALQWLALHRERLDAVVAGPPAAR